MSSTEQLLKDLTKQNQREEFEKKSDSELQQLSLDRSRMIMALGTSARDHSRGVQMLAEMELCREIIEERREKKQRTKDAMSEWEGRLEERQHAAILNLKKAASANGQLIAAILEDEDGKKTEELAGFCEELASIEEVDFKELLDGLVEEGIIELKEDRYYLKNICTEDLFPEDPVTWCMSKLREAMGQDCGGYTSTAKLIFNLMASEQKGYTAETLLGEINDYGFIYVDEEIDLSKVLKEERRLDILLTRMHQYGVLKREANCYPHMYYFPMLGEKEE